MKSRIFLSLIMIAYACGQLHAQINFFESPDAYLGQPQPGETPVKFAPGMLAKKPEFSANKVAFSPDGKEFYYCLNKTWKNREFLKINYFRFEDGKWQGPFLLNRHFNLPELAPDGKSLYFNDGQTTTWRSEKTQNGWSEPAPFLQGHALYGPVFTTSGTLYAGTNEFTGADLKPNNVDVCSIIISGSDTTIQSLGIPLNSPGWNGDFFIARDGSFIIISAKETNNAESELYISFHKPGGSWTNPKSLGKKINNDLAHRYGQYVTADNRFLFYTYAHSEKDCSVYWVRFDKLYNRLKQTNFEPYVYDSLKNETVEAGKTFSLQVPEKTFVDDDGNNTLTYSAQLSNGKPLPSWLKFDKANKKILGKPPVPGSFGLSITVSDKANAKAKSTFTLTVTGS